MSELPGVSIWTVFEQAGCEFPFWVMPWWPGPTVARVFDFYRVLPFGTPPCFAANVLDLETGMWRAWNDGTRLIVRIPIDESAGWRLTHVDPQSN